MPAVRGRVVNAKGEPVAGAAVYFVRAPVSLPDIAAWTAANGEVVLSAPVAGVYRVGARADDETGEVDVTVAADRPAEFEIRLGSRR